MLNCHENYLFRMILTRDVLEMFHEIYPIYETQVRDPRRAG